MPYIIRVYFKDRIYNIDLAYVRGATIGCDVNDTVPLDAYGLAKGQIKFTESKNKFFIKGKGIFTAEGSPVLSSDELAVGKKYILTTKPEISISVHPKQENSIETMSIYGMNQIRIGRNANNDVILKNRKTSGEHCVITIQGDTVKIKDLNSTNGTYVNGQKVNEAVLTDNVVISISIYRIVLKNKTLYFYNTGNDLILNTDRTIYDKPKEERIDESIERVGKSFREPPPEMLPDYAPPEIQGGTVSAYDLKERFDKEDPEKKMANEERLDEIAEEKEYEKRNKTVSAYDQRTVSAYDFTAGANIEEG